MPSSVCDRNVVRWFVLRDLKRANAKERAHHLFKDMNLEHFTPMKSVLRVVKGKQVCTEVPCIPDLLFVHDSREHLDPIIDDTSTVQYRWLRNKYREPMVVSDAEMERFIHAVSVSASSKYYPPEEITPSMLKRRIRIVGGPLNGYEGTLLTTRGSKVKRLLVEIPHLLAAGVEVNPDFIQLVDERN